MKVGSVLVTDGFWQKALAVVRALGRVGINVDVVAETVFAAAYYSRYCRRRIRSPLMREDPEGFVECVVREAARSRCEMVIPMEDETIALLGEHRERFPAYTYLPIPPQASLLHALDKWETLETGRQLGIPVPATRLIRDLSELDEASRRVPYPAVVKPRRSWGARGIRYVDGPEELRRAYLATHRTYPYPLIQERLALEGTPFAVNLLFDRTERAIAGLVQKSHREYPVTGGSSTLRETIAHPVMLEQAIALMKALRWSGVAQVEFKLDPRDGVPKLMEINPRFWNSLQLSIDAGMNFPALLYRVGRGEHIEPVFDYPLGVRSRWLIPGDVLHFMSNPNRWSMQPSFFNFSDDRTRFEDFSLEDPQGMVGVWLSILSSLGSRRVWQFALRRQT